MNSNGLEVTKDKPKCRLKNTIVHKSTIYNTIKIISTSWYLLSKYCYIFLIKSIFIINFTNHSPTRICTEVVE